MPTEAERLVEALTAEVRTGARRRKAPAPAPRKPSAPVKAEPVNVYDIVRSVSDVLEQVDVRRPGGKFSDETWDSMDELLKAADECYDNFADFDIDAAVRDLNKLDTEYDKVVDKLKEEQDAHKSTAEDVVTACDKWSVRLRDLEAKHPELSGYDFDRFVQEVEALADMAHDVVRAWRAAQ